MRQGQLCTVLVANSGHAPPFDLECYYSTPVMGIGRPSVCIHRMVAPLAARPHKLKPEPYGSATDIWDILGVRVATPVGYWQIF